MNKVLGASILALLVLAGMAGTAQAGNLTAGERASADWYAGAALRENTTEGRAFRKCIWAGRRVYAPGNFVGRECVGASGETFTAGLVWVWGKPRLNTGP